MRTYFHSAIVALAALCILIGAEAANAAVVTNSDIVGGKADVTLPDGWQLNTSLSETITDYAALFDGVTANRPSAGRILWENVGGDNLSSTNYISIVANLTSPFDVRSLGLAHDWGGLSEQEITAAVALLSNDGGVVKQYDIDELDDDQIEDIDFLFTGESYKPVTKIELRITGNENEQYVELREVVVEGAPIPEPASYLTFAGLAICFGLASWRRRRGTS